MNVPIGGSLPRVLGDHRRGFEVRLRFCWTGVEQMAKTMCPLCGARMHINTGDPAAYEARYPEILEVGFACRLCLQCGKELLPGDRVLIRSGESAGKQGRIDRIARCDGRGILVRVALDEGLCTTVPRGHVAKQETDTTCPN